MEKNNISYFYIFSIVCLYAGQYYSPFIQLQFLVNHRQFLWNFEKTVILLFLSEIACKLHINFTELYMQSSSNMF